MIRLQYESGNANDIGYHFSFAFRAIKRYMNDMAGTFVDSVRLDMSLCECLAGRQSRGARALTSPFF